MDSLITLAYIKEILDDPNVALIEVWHNQLYIRMKPGCGRGTFISKRGLEYSLPIYYGPENYKTVSKQFHPDRAYATKTKKSRSSSTRSATAAKQKQLSRLEELQKDINIHRQELCDAFNRRAADAISVVRSLPAFTKFASTKVSSQRNKFRLQLEQELDRTGLCNSPGFYGTNTGSIWERNIDENSDDAYKNAFQELATAWARANERARKARPEYYAMYDKLVEATCDW